MKSKKIKVFLFSTAILLGAVVLNSYGFGENGCVNKPNYNKGDCKMNTERTYDCIPDWAFNDCISG